MRATIENVQLGSKLTNGRLRGKAVKPASHLWTHPDNPLITFSKNRKPVRKADNPSNRCAPDFEPQVVLQWGSDAHPRYVTASLASCVHRS